MELVRFRFKDIVEYRKSTYRFLPDSKVALIVAGEAVGCLDMTKIRPQDVVFEGDSVVRVALPVPELCTWRVDHSQSKVYRHRKTRFFRMLSLSTKATATPSATCAARALQSGILPQTTQNAEKILRPMLETMTGPPRSAYPTDSSAQNANSAITGGAYCHLIFRVSLPACSRSGTCSRINWCSVLSS